MFNQLQNFAPTPHGTVTIASTATSAAVAFTAGPTTSRDVRVFNAGPNVAYIEFGGPGVAASPANSLPIPVTGASGPAILFAGGATYVAAVCATGNTAAVSFSSGVGN